MRKPGRPRTTNSITMPPSGRPRPNRVNFELDDGFAEVLDEWRRSHKNPPSRSAALKELARQRLREWLPDALQYAAAPPQDNAA